MTNIKRLIIFCLLASAAILISSYLLLVAWKEADRKENLNDFLNTPIPTSVADDLCSRKLVPKEIAQCDGEIKIARRDILQIFQNQVSSQSTYNQVSELFGIYEEFCYQQTPETYQCSYFFKTAPRVLVEYDKYDKAKSVRSELTY